MSILMIANPVSGRYNKGKLEKAASILDKRFGEVSVKLTEYAGHAQQIATEAQEDMIIACGGDGLINETARAIINTDKMFSVLPFGTVNVLCREYSIPLDPIKAAQIAKFEEPEFIPAGYVNNTPFLMMAGFGFDAATVEKVHNSEKRPRYKTLAHLTHGADVFFNSQFDPFTVYNMGMKQNAYHMIVSLGKRYGGRFSLGKVQAGHLNVFMINDESRYSLAKNALSISLGQGFSGDSFVSDYLKITNVSKCQMDGEFVDIGKQSSYIRIERNAVRFVR